MRRGEKFENKLFKLCREANVSPNQLKMLGYKQTFSELRAKHCFRSQIKVRYKGVENQKKEAVKNRDPFLGLRQGTLRRLFREHIIPAATPLLEEENPPDITPPDPDSPTPTNPLVERIQRVRISKLKKNKALQDMKGRALENQKTNMKHG